MQKRNYNTYETADVLPPDEIGNNGVEWFAYCILGYSHGILSLVNSNIKLLEEMALACGYKDIRWDDLKRYYYPNGLLNRKNDDEVLKKLQIKAAEKTASDAVGQQNTPQNEQFANQMMLQLLPKLIENPDSFSKLIEFADKAKK